MTPRAHLKAFLLASSFAVTSLGPRLAGAQTAPPDGFAINRFEPAERGSSWFVLDSLPFEGDLIRPALGLTLDYANNPLAIKSASGDDTATMVGHTVTGHVGGNLVFWERMRVGVNLPVVLYTTGESGLLGRQRYVGPADSTTVGDLRFGLDFRLFGTSTNKITGVLGGRVWAPTGSAASYTGDGKVRVGPRLALAGVLGKMAYAVHGGFTYRDAIDFGEVKVGSDISYGAAVGGRLKDGKIVIGPELYGSTQVNGQAFKTRGSPLELLLGGHFALGHGASLGVGVGAGLVSGLGTPAVRAVGSFDWVMEKEAPPDADHDGILDAQDACPSKAGPGSSDPTKNGCPEEGPRDTDGDGIPDVEDACADMFGKRTNDKRTNGCDDRDKDGIMDPLDACMTIPGSPSSDPKGNGCPGGKVPIGPDQDKDGIPDDVDACPEVFGNKNTDPALNGCPDPDPDKDGIPTETDACPDVPGKADPDAAFNGCPGAFLQGKKVKLKKAFVFRVGSGVLPQDDNDATLNGLVEMMKRHPEITKLHVEVHSDGKGPIAAQRSISELRARAIVSWLNDHGVSITRVLGAGVGPDKPPAGEKPRERVELFVDLQE